VLPLEKYDSKVMQHWKQIVHEQQENGNHCFFFTWTEEHGENEQVKSNYVYIYDHTGNVGNN